jgi:hypothetical protein
MISASTPLPVELIGALERLDVSLRSNRIDQRALDAVLTLIDALDPEYIPAAEVSFRRHLLMMEQFVTRLPRTPAPVASGTVWRLARRLLSASAKPLHAAEMISVLHRDGKPDLDLLARAPRLAIIYLRHENGFVREAALKALAAEAVTPFVLASIAYRLNDWVSPVRLAAVDAIDRILPLTSDTTIMKAAPFLVLHSAEWERWKEHAHVLDGMLHRPSAIARIVDFVVESGARGTVALLQYCLPVPAIDQHLPRLARHARTPAVRAIASEALITGTARWPTGWEAFWIDKYAGKKGRKRTYACRAIESSATAQATLIDAAADRAATVRKIAADAIINGLANPETWAVVVSRLQNDPNRGVRERVEFARRNRGNGD